MGRRFRELLRRQPSDEVVCFTHTAPDRFADGEVCDRDGQRWRITRVVRTSDTLLLAGGTAPCWEIRGVPVED
jgi:hypothetical protein